MVAFIFVVVDGLIFSDFVFRAKLLLNKDIGAEYSGRSPKLKRGGLVKAQMGDPVEFGRAGGPV